MNYRRKLSSKVAMVTALVVLAALMIALVAVPAGALNKAPLLHSGGDVLNAPDPAIPTLINYQGTLFDPATGNPVADGQYQFVFSIYDSDTGGTQLWQETQQVTVENGLFSVLLGNQTALSASVFEGSPRYLGIKVGADAEMTPRQLLTSVAYAFQAENADTLDGQHGSYYLNASNINQGTLNDARLSANVSLLGSSIETGEITDGTISFADIGQNGGAVGQVMKWNGTSWVCASDEDTTYSAGTGLMLTGTMFSVNFAGNGVATTVSRSDHNHDAVYVAVTGDTMTGTLNLPANGLVAGGDQLVLTGGRVGIGTSDPIGDLGNYKLSVLGWPGADGIASSGDTCGVYGAGETYGVYGFAGNYGVYGEHSAYGNHGILGTGNCGVYGYGYGSTWDFYAGGPGPDYGPFTGAHEVKLSDDFPENIKPGMIVSVTGETQIRTIDEESISFSSTLPTVQLSDTPNDSRVLGVLISECPLGEDHWYEADEGDRFGIVNALGEGRVWVTNINGDIAAGDYITTSAIAGYGQKQDDDLLHSYTLGKAIENVDWSIVTETIEFNGQTYKAYPIAVVYTSG